MSTFIRSAEHAPAPRARWRSVLAVTIVAGLTTIGITTLAAPAAAEESGLSTVESTAPDGDTPDTGGPEEKSESAAPEENGQAAAPEENGQAAAPEENGQAAAPEETSTAPTDVSAPAASSIALLVPPPPDEVVDKVEICHGTASYKNPYIINEPAAAGDVQGHADHTGPIFYPEIPKHTEWGDIIPPFLYGDPENPSSFPGLNWDAAGRDIYANDCEIPTPVPDLVIFPEDCRFYGETGALEVEVGSVQENVDYLVTVWDSEGDPVDDWFISGETGTVSMFWILPPGDYTITLEQSIIEGEWDLLDEQTFTISACPDLDVTVTADECSTGNDSTAVVLFTGLIVGEAYSFSLDGPGDYFVFGEFIATATSEELVADLPPGDFVASIEWIPGPGVELDPVVAMTTFTVVPCPVPPKTVTPAGLAVTGTEPAPFISAALLLFGLGGAMLLAASRRRAGSSRTE